MWLANWPLEWANWLSSNWTGWSRYPLNCYNYYSTCGANNTIRQSSTNLSPHSSSLVYSYRTLFCSLHSFVSVYITHSLPHSCMVDSIDLALGDEDTKSILDDSARFRRSCLCDNLVSLIAVWQFNLAIPKWSFYDVLVTDAWMTSLPQLYDSFSIVLMMAMPRVNLVMHFEWNAGNLGKCSQLSGQPYHWQCF